MHNSKIGLGWIPRGDEGQFIATKCTPLQGNFSPKEVGAMVVRETLLWLKNKSYDKVLVETNSLLVVKALGHEVDSSFDLLIVDIKDIVKRSNHVNIYFVKRSANRTTHK